MDKRRSHNTALVGICVLTYKDFVRFYYVFFSRQEYVPYHEGGKTHKMLLGHVCSAIHADLEI